MDMKKRTKPVTLQVLEALNCRMELPDFWKKEYRNQDVGYEAEAGFDVERGKHLEHCLAVSDLRLRNGSSSVQMDAVILVEKALWIYEIKNYAGAYTYKEDALHGRSDFIISNPETQFRTSKPVLHNLIRQMGYRHEVKTQVVFMNPDFYLYELPRNKPFVFAGQLSGHLQRLGRHASAASESDKRLMRELCAQHIEDYRPPNLPDYTFEELRKGIYCPKCFSFGHMDTRQTRVCDCGYREIINEAIRRNIKEFRLLFPQMKMTVPIIHTWCGGEYNKQRIYNVLQTAYQAKGSYRYTHYC